MKTIHLKLPKNSKKEKNAAIQEPTSDEYPYGLRINLNEGQVKKLPHLMDYKVDSTVSIVAMGKIIGIRSNEQSGGKEDRSIEIQLTSIGCEKAAPKKKVKPSTHEDGADGFYHNLK